MIFGITKALDASDPGVNARYNGNAKQAVWGKFAGLLRLLADVNGLSLLRMMFWYNGSKLSIFFEIGGNADGIDQKIARQFVNSFSCESFGFLECNDLPAIPNFQHNVKIFRRVVKVPSSITTSENPNALDRYITIKQFQPNKYCDLMTVEQAFGTLTRPAVIDVSLRPVETDKYISELSRHNESLKMVNSYASSQDSFFSNQKLPVEWAAVGRNSKINDPIADDIRRENSKLLQSLTETNLQFSINVSADDKSVSQYLASVCAEDMFESGSYQINDSSEADKEQIDSDEFKELLSLRSIAPIPEIETAFRPIIAGIRKTTVIPCHTDPPDYSTDQMLIVGKDVKSSTKNKEVLRGPQISKLCQHSGLFGTSGSGKSTLGYSALLQLAELGIFFLVLECGSKTDYRALIKALKRHANKKLRKIGRKIRLLTPGDESINPPRINPFLVPKNVPIYLHAENILACLLAGMAWPDPLPSILKRALYNMYYEFQFKGIKPSMKRFCDHAFQQLQGLDYDTKTKGDIKAALETRLSVFTTGIIGRIFQTESNNPLLDELVNGFTIIELAMLPDEARPLMTFSLITQLSEIMTVTPWNNAYPRLCIFLEEAHNIIPPTSIEAASEEDARVKASRLMLKQLHEARSKGCSYSIISQSPANVDKNVLKACTTTILGKQREQEDIQVVGSSMMFDQADYASVRQLVTGEFFVFTEGYKRPCLVRTPDICSEVNLDGSAFGKTILGHISDTEWFKTDLRLRTTEELSMLNDRLNDFENQVLKAIKAIQMMLTASENSRDNLREIRSLRAKIDKKFETFFRDEMVPLAGLDIEVVLPEDIEELRQILLNRFNLLRQTAERFVAKFN